MKKTANESTKQILAQLLTFGLNPMDWFIANDWRGNDLDPRAEPFPQSTRLIHRRDSTFQLKGILEMEPKRRIPYLRELQIVSV